MDMLAVDSGAPTAKPCFFRTAGDDWREDKALRFQWGRLIPATDSTPAYVKGYDITGCAPLGRLLMRTPGPPPPGPRAPSRMLYQFGGDLTVDAGTAVVDDPLNGKFSFTPLRALTSTLVALALDAGPSDARLYISAKLTMLGGSLNTLRTVPIVVYPG